VLPITLFYQTRKDMASIKTIAIVGATGSMGSAIANALSKNKKYRLLLMSTDETKLVGLKLKLQKAGAEVYALSCAKEASWEADIIFVATPYGAEKDVAEKIRDVVTGKVVISHTREWLHQGLVQRRSCRSSYQIQKL
jgi:predicted dinucleotide-binding enzyme